MQQMKKYTKVIPTLAACVLMLFCVHTRSPRSAVPPKTANPLLAQFERYIEGAQIVQVKRSETPLGSTPENIQLLWVRKDQILMAGIWNGSHGSVDVYDIAAQRRRSVEVSSPTDKVAGPAIGRELTMGPGGVLQWLDLAQQPRSCRVTGSPERPVPDDTYANPIMGVRIKHIPGDESVGWVGKYQWLGSSKQIIEHGTLPSNLAACSLSPLGLSRRGKMSYWAVPVFDRVVYRSPSDYPPLGLAILALSAGTCKVTTMIHRDAGIPQKLKGVRLYNASLDSPAWANADGKTLVFRRTWRAMNPNESLYVVELLMRRPTGETRLIDIRASYMGIGANNWEWHVGPDGEIVKQRQTDCAAGNSNSDLCPFPAPGKDQLAYCRGDRLIILEGKLQ